MINAKTHETVKCTWMKMSRNGVGSFFHVTVISLKYRGASSGCGLKRFSHPKSFYICFNREYQTLENFNFFPVLGRINMWNSSLTKLKMDPQWIILNSN